MGPKARDLLTSVSPDDFSNEAMPFGSAREVEIGMGLARVHRISYVGELGWEVCVPSDMAAHVCEVLIEAGADHGLHLCGLHAMDSWSHREGLPSLWPRHHARRSRDRSRAGLCCAKGQNRLYRCRRGSEKKREAGMNQRLVQFLLTDPEPLLYHNEPILRDGQVVGYLSTGSYGHTLGAAVGLRLGAPARARTRRRF